jgi:hypothetical protein
VLTYCFFNGSCLAELASNLLHLVKEGFEQVVRNLFEAHGREEDDQRVECIGNAICFILLNLYTENIKLK